MAAATLAAEITVPAIANPVLVQAVVSSVTKALQMCSLKCELVGMARIPAQERGMVTGMIGIHGKVSGFMTANFSEVLAVRAVEGLIQEKFGKLSNQVVDGTGEITNIIVGGVKAQLAGTAWAFAQITVPSVIVGRGYQIAFARGLEYLTATFEVEDEAAIMIDDRLLHVSLSLLRL
jgi:chemotaxis protein CheX